jgi:hypothetical protein
VIKYPNRIFWTAILVAWCFDFLFWEKSSGISFIIFVGLTIGAGLYLAWVEKSRLSRGAKWLLVPIFVFSMGTFLRREPFTSFVNYLLTLFLMGIFAHTFRGGRWLNYSLSDYIAAFFYLVVSALAKPVEILRGKNAHQEGENGTQNYKPSKWKRIFPSLRGLLIAIPIVGLFASLLAAADPVFANYLEDIIQIFKLENLPEYIFRGVYILILGYLLTGIYAHAFTHKKEENLIGEEKPWIPTFLGFTESSIVLGSVDVLFVSFVGIQFRYFFGGQSNVKIDGYTYAEYARRGFSELVIVAFLSLLLFLGLSAIAKRENNSQRRAFSGLGILLVVLVAVILVSAFQRLLLYEQVYGFTRLRAYSHIFMVWLGILLVAVVVLELIRKQRSFALATLVASIGFVLTLNIINIDNLIVKQNIQRTLQGEELDTYYFQSLSSDAIPAIVEAQKNPQLSEQDRDGLSATLACQIAVTAEDRESQTWSSFHWADHRAWGLLINNRDLFKAAQVYRDQNQVWWVMVNGESQPCHYDPYRYD